MCNVKHEGLTVLFFNTAVCGIRVGRYDVIYTRRQALTLMWAVLQINEQDFCVIFESMWRNNFLTLTSTASQLILGKLRDILIWKHKMIVIIQNRGFSPYRPLLQFILSSPFLFPVWFPLISLSCCYFTLMIFSTWSCSNSTAASLTPRLSVLLTMLTLTMLTPGGWRG